MSERSEPIIFDDCRGGQNTAAPPHAVGPTQVTVARNIEWYLAPVGRKRRGSRLLERDTGSTLPTNEPFCTLYGAPLLESTSGTTWVVLAQGASSFDAFLWGDFLVSPYNDWQAGLTMAAEACVVAFNDKWVYAHDSAVDRLFFTAVGGMTTPQYVGLAAPTIGAVTESAGAATDNRKYRSVVTGSAYATRSEPSAETGVRTLTAEQASIAAPGAAAANQDLYDGWELQAASDDDNYATWWIVGTANATTAIVDNNTSLFGLTPAPELGLFEVPRSHKYLVVDESRLLMAGAYESTSSALQQRVWFTPRLGDRDQGDDQRVPDTASGQKNWVDIDAGDSGGPITAFGPATLGDILVFKRTQVWRLVRTGNLSEPYAPRAIDKSVGTFGYRTVCSGQDALGGPCVYFVSARGPMRVGRAGLEYLGAAIEDIWATVNQHGNPHQSQHAVYYQDRGQYWLWVSVGAATVPSVLLIYTVQTGGWASYTGPLATARCSAMLPRYINESNKGITTTNVLTAPLVPYCCPNTNGQIVECDAINPQTGVALDTDLETYSGSGSVWSDGTAYQGTLTLRPLSKPLDSPIAVEEVTVVAPVQSGVTLTVGLTPDYDTSRTRTATVSVAALGSESRIVRRVDGAQYGAARALQVSIGDGSAVASQWAVDAVQVRVKPGATR